MFLPLPSPPKYPGLFCCPLSVLFIGYRELLALRVKWPGGEADQCRVCNEWRNSSATPRLNDVQERPDRTWGLPSPLFSGYRDCFLGVKRLRSGVYFSHHLLLRWSTSGVVSLLLYAFVEWRGEKLCILYTFENALNCDVVQLYRK